MGRQTAGVAHKTPAIGAFSADSVAEEHRQKINDLIASKTLPRKAYPLAELGQTAVHSQVLDKEHDFAKPGRGRGNELRGSLDAHRSISVTFHMCLVSGNVFAVSFSQ